MKTDTPESVAAWRALLGIMRDAQARAGMSQTQAGPAAGRTQSWYSKVMNRRIKPDTPSVLKFLRATGATAEVLAEAEELCEKLQGVTDVRANVIRIGNVRWRSAITEVEAARSLTIFSPAIIPVELCTPATYALYSGDDGESWRRTNVAKYFGGAQMEPTTDYLFILSEASILSALTLGREDLKRQLKFSKLDARARMVVAPMHAIGANVTPFVLIDKAALLARVPGGAVCAPGGDSLREARDIVARACEAAPPLWALNTWLQKIAATGEMRPLPRKR